MKPLLPVVVAGGTFAAAAVIGLLIGVLAADRTGQQVWAPVGLLFGAAAGAYAAIRLLMRSLS